MSTPSRPTTAATFAIAAIDATHIAYDGPPPMPLRTYRPSIAAAAASGYARGLDQLWLHPSWCPTPEAPDLWDEPADGSGRGITIDPHEPGHWTRATRPGRFQITYVVSVAHDSNRVWNAAADARELVAAVSRYNIALGTVYAYSPGATGTRLLRALHSGRGRTIPIDLPGALPACAEERNIMCPIHWIRPLSQDERRRAYLHSYDKNGAWLAAASNLALGYGEPEHVVPPDMTADDLRAPGYFRIHLSDRWTPDPLASLLPPVLPRPSRRGSSLVWVTQPTLALLTEAGANVGITEAWVWRTHHKPLTPWQKRLSAARTALMADETPAGRIALSALKATYTHTLGRLGSKGIDRALVGTDLYRPDWMQHNRALAYANMHRQLWRMAREDGVYPFAVGGQDTFYVVSDEPDPYRAAPPSLRMGTALGQWKPKDSAIPLPEVIAEVERGPHPDEWHGRLLRLQTWLNARRRTGGA